MFRVALRLGFRSAVRFASSGLRAARSTKGRSAGLFAGCSMALAGGLMMPALLKDTPMTGVAGTEKERTFIAIKPDGVQRKLIGDIVGRFEKKGFKLVAMKLIQPSEAFASRHYGDLAGRPFFPGLVKYFSSGPVVAMVWEGPNVIKEGRKMLGATNPTASAPGTIRGDFCVATGRNVCHGSDGPESAAKEISLWFKEAEMTDHDPALEEWTNCDN